MKDQENPPQFLRDFSKQNSPEERNQAAQEIRGKRQEYFDRKADQDKTREQKSQLEQELEVLAGKMETYNNASFFQKISEYLSIQKIKAELSEKSDLKKGLTEQLAEPETGRPELDEARQMLKNFYDNEKQKWAEAPYVKEDIVENFSEEHLASLSVEDYTTLMRRFPNEMVTHITRQGVRDHAELGNHQKGLGEYHSGFETILQKQRLQSAIGMALQEKSKEEAIAQFLGLDDCPSRNAALGRILTRFDSAIIGDPNAFADNSAIHLATESIADAYYGSERNNEIFFVFPSAYIASQHAFDDSGQNDQYAWTDLEKGMNINAGIVFIPEDARVDSESGSQYTLDKDKHPIPAKGIQEILQARFGDKPGFVQDFLQKLPLYLAEKKNATRDELLQDASIQKLFQEYSIDDSTVQRALLDKDIMDKLDRLWGSNTEKDAYTELLSGYFQKNGVAQYKLSENTVSAKEYWEKYFDEHQKLRPKHIVYYSGGDPTAALNQWKQKNGLTKRGKMSDIGFSENEISRDVKNADEIQQRFVSLARNLVDKRFPTTDTVPSYNYSWE